LTIEKHMEKRKKAAQHKQACPAKFTEPKRSKR